MILNMLRLSYTLLISVSIFGLFWYAPQDTHPVATGIVALVVYLPLLAMLPTLVNGSKRLATWLCFALLFYFCAYTLLAAGNGPFATLAYLQIALTVVTFIFSALIIRYHAHAD